MTFPIIYIILFIATLASYFKKDWQIKYKKWLLYGHIISFILLMVDVVIITKFNSSFRTFWADRFIVLAFLVTGSLIFAMYARKMNMLANIYFGSYFFYPIIAALTFLIDRMFFALVAGPIIISLVSPKIYYCDSEYDIRTAVGLIAPKEIILVKKSWMVESEIGRCENDLKENARLENLKIEVNNNGTTNVLVDIDGQKSLLIFEK